MPGANVQRLPRVELSLVHLNLVREQGAGERQVQGRGQAEEVRARGRPLGKGQAIVGTIHAHHGEDRVGLGVDEEEAATGHEVDRVVVVACVHQE